MPNTRPLEDFKLEMRDGTEYTIDEQIQFSNDLTFARQEASHAVAAWMVDVPIIRVELLDVQHSIIHGGETTTGTGMLVSEMPERSRGELWVYGCKQAFLTLAGPHGSGESKSENPLCVYSTNDHFSQAKKRLKDIAGMSEGEAETEGLRLLDVVKWVTAHPRFQHAVTKLSAELIRLRKLSGEQAVAVISQAWEESFGR